MWYWWHSIIDSYSPTGSIPWFVVAEMFVQETRDPAIVVTVIVNWLAQIVISLGYPPLLASSIICSFKMVLLFTLVVFINLMSVIYYVWSISKVIIWGFRFNKPKL